MNHLTRSVLDHGEVILRNISGPTRRPGAEFDADSVDPANSARMSFGQMDSGRTREMDLKLCRYLMENHHNTPIEMIEVWFEMKLPIFVARQFVRHRTVTINEISGRYVKLPDTWYVPKIIGAVSKDKKQGQELTLPDGVQAEFRQKLNHSCRESYRAYEWALASGVAPEHARLLLHLNHYTHWLWKQNLHNLLHFLHLRSGAHAQIEAQMYAHAIESLLDDVLPETMAMVRELRC